MDYLKIYNRIVARGKIEKREKGKGVYYEAHHILPKCMGGDGLVSGWRKHPNITLLTAREHFLCHLLLCKIYPSNNKLWSAIVYMSFIQKERGYKISSRLYQELTLIKASLASLINKGKKFSEEHKRKISEKTKGHTRGLGKKASEKTRAILSLAQKGKKVSQETRDKLSKAFKGKKKKPEHCKHLNIKVKQWTLDWVFIKEWESLSDAAKSECKFDKAAISRCCLGKKMSHKKFRWTYSDESHKDKILNNTGPSSSKKFTGDYVKIKQWARDGIFIKEWDSMKEAENAPEKPSEKGIQACCSGRRNFHRNFMWTYSDTNHKPRPINKNNSRTWRKIFDNTRIKT